MKLPYKRSGLRTYLILIGIIANSSTPFWIFAGLPFFVGGIIIRMWAKGCLHQNREVTTSGPYAFIRHPFYLGNLMLDSGIVIMSGFIPLILFFPFLWLYIYIPTINREESLLLELFGDKYKVYRENVPLLFPFKRISTSGKGFSWDNPNIYRTEIPRTIRFLSYPFIFYLIYLLRAQWLYAFYSPKTLIICTLIATSYVMAWEVKRYLAYSSNTIFFSILMERKFLLLIGIIVLGFFIHWSEVEYDPFVWPFGISLLGISIFVKNPIKSEWLIATGLSIVFELIWLALVISPIYIGFLLNKVPTKSRRDRKHLRFLALFMGLLLAIFKELEVTRNLFCS